MPSLDDLTSWERLKILKNLETLAETSPHLTLSVALAAASEELFLVPSNDVGAKTVMELAEYAGKMPSVVTALTEQSSGTLYAIKELRIATGVDLKSAKKAIHCLKYEILKMPHPTYIY